MASPPDFTITRPPGASSLEPFMGSKPSPALTSTAPPSFNTVAALKGLAAMAVERSPARSTLLVFSSIGPFPALRTEPELSFDSEQWQRDAIGATEIERASWLICHNS